LVASVEERDADGVVQLSPDQQRVRLMLRNEGPAKVDYDVEADGYLAVIGNGGGKLLGFRTAALELQVKPDAPGEFSAQVRIRSNDGNRQHWWECNVQRSETLELTVRRLRGARITSFTRVVLLPELNSWQSFTVRNVGDMTAESELEVPADYSIAVGRDLPKGFEGGRSAKVTLEPGDWQRVWVRQDSLSAGQRAVVRGLDAEVELKLLHTRRGGFKPKLIVGIDFGTVNTSVLIREPSSGKEVWVLGRERVPSLLYVPFNPDEKPVIGVDAERFFGRDTGMVIDGIKTLVRREGDEYRGFSVERLLRMYLSALKEAIEESFRANRWQDQGDVMYVFTLPVLDAGERYQRQRDRMRKAAVGAGFPDDDEVLWFVPEPVAAALFCLRHSDDVFGGNPPEEFAVLDAGGGTTDVCVGRVSVDESGKWRFEPEKALSLRPNPSESAEFYHNLIYHKAAVREDQLGGRLLDYDIAYSLEGRDGTPARLCREPWLKLYRGEASRQVEVAVREYILGISTVKEDICSNQPRVSEVDLAATGGRLSAMGFYKYFYNRYEEGHLLTSDLVRELAPTGRAAITYQGDIASKVRALWQQSGVGELLQRELSPYSEQLRIVAVGGTSAIPVFRECAEDFARRSVIDPRAYRHLAVVRGAVMAYDAFAEGVSRYPILLKLTGPEGSSSHYRILDAYQSLSAPTPFSRQYELAPEEKVKAEVQVQLAGGPITVSRSSYCAPKHGSIEIRVSYDGDGVLRAAWFAEREGMLPFWEMRG